MDEVISWKNVLGNKFRYGLHPEMLSLDGYLLTVTIPIKGESKSSKMPRKIHFDEEYVCAYINQYIVSKLYFEDYSAYEQFMQAVWFKFQDEKVL